MKKIKKILIGLGLVVVCAGLIFLMFNFNSFWKQLVFLVHKPNVIQTENSFGNNETGTVNELSIPSLGITAPIVEAVIFDGQDAVSTEKSFQEALQFGVVHYPGTAAVGELGNAYLFGHSSDFAFKEGNFKTVFALLPQIQKGAEIVVSNKDGQIFHYEVIDTRVVNKDDLSVLDQNGFKEKLLSLQTSYPVGTALQRWVVVARLKD